MFDTLALIQKCTKEICFKLDVTKRLNSNTTSSLVKSQGNHRRYIRRVIKPFC